MIQNSEYATIVRQSSYVIAANIVTFILSLALIPILTKGLGATQYGIWSLINITVALTVSFALLHFHLSIIRFLAAEKDKGTIREDFFSACFIVFISGIIFSIALFLLSDFLASSIFSDAGASIYIKLASILILFNAINQLMLAFFRMRRQIGVFTAFTVFYNVSQVILIVASLALGYQLTGVIAAAVINGLIFNLAALFVILRQVEYEKPKFLHMTTYLKWGIPLVPNLAILWIIDSSDKYIISYFLGVTEAGIYSAAYTIGNFANFAIAPVATVLYPALMKSYNEGNAGLTINYLEYSTKYLMMIIIPSAFGLTLLAKPLLNILTTPEFQSGSVVVPFIAFCAVPYVWYQIPIWINHLVNKTYITIFLIGLTATISIVLNIVLIPYVGVVGAAISKLASYIVLAMVTLIVTRRYMKFNLSLTFIGKSIVAAGFMSLCIWLINPQSLMMVILSILLGVLIYLTILWAMKGVSKSEMTFFAGFIKGNIRKIGLFKE